MCIQSLGACYRIHKTKESKEHCCTYPVRYSCDTNIQYIYDDQENVCNNRTQNDSTDSVVPPAQEQLLAAIDTMEIILSISSDPEDWKKAANSVISKKSEWMKYNGKG